MPAELHPARQGTENAWPEQRHPEQARFQEQPPAQRPAPPETETSQLPAEYSPGSLQAACTDLSSSARMAHPAAEA